MVRESLIFQLKPANSGSERHLWFDAAEGSLAAVALKNVQVLNDLSSCKS
jgi:hypothetical protein